MTEHGCCAACAADRPSAGPAEPVGCDGWVWAAPDAPGSPGVSQCWLLHGCTSAGGSAHRSFGFVSPVPTPPPPTPPPTAPRKDWRITASPTAVPNVFRLGIRFGSADLAPLQSPMLRPDLHTGLHTGPDAAGAAAAARIDLDQSTG